MKTFSALGLRPKDKKKESKKKKDDTAAVVPSTKKTKSKPFEEGKKQKKVRRERSLSPIPEEMRSKKRLLKLAEVSLFSSKADDKVSVIVVDPINVANTATTPTTPLAPCVARPAQRGIIIWEPALEEPSPKDVPEGKGKKKQKEAFVALSRDSTPSPIKRAKREVEEHRLRKETWL